MNSGQLIRLLVNYRYHKKGRIGLIYEQLNEDVASVDLNWNNDSKAKHTIFIRKENEGEFWEFVN